MHSRSSHSMLVRTLHPISVRCEHDLGCVSALAGKTTCSLQGGELKASIAFPALALFDLFRNPIRLIPDSLNMLVNAYIAVKRLQAYIDVRSSTPCSSAALIDAPLLPGSTYQDDGCMCLKPLWLHHVGACN